MIIMHVYVLMVIAGEISVAIGSATAIQAMWCKMYRIRQSHALSYLYNLYTEHCQCYGELNNFIPTVLIFVETIWPGRWSAMAVLGGRSLVLE